MKTLVQLYLIPFLHQTTTWDVLLRCIMGCILFHFYIKPQHLHSRFDLINVVSYSISTSNHNPSRTASVSMSVVSYSISTSNHNTCGISFGNRHVVSYSISTSNHNPNIEKPIKAVLYLIPFLHQTTTSNFQVIKEFKLYLIPFLHQTTTCT